MFIETAYIIAASISAVFVGMLFALLLAMFIYSQVSKKGLKVAIIFATIVVVILLEVVFGVIFLPDIFGVAYGGGFVFLFDNLGSAALVWVIISFLLGAIFSFVLLVVGFRKVIRVEKAVARYDFFLDEE